MTHDPKDLEIKRLREEVSELRKDREAQMGVGNGRMEKGGLFVYGSIEAIMAAQRLVLGPDKPPSPRPSATKMNALLTALDALRADVEELGGEYERGLEYTLDLETQLSDLTDDFHRVMDEDCSTDEKHCSCVPHLRRRIAELEAPGECNSIHKLQAQIRTMGSEIESIAPLREELLDTKIAVRHWKKLATEVDDLHSRMIRVENGDESAAPDGWMWTTQGWRKADLLVKRKWMFGPCVRVVLDEDGHEIHCETFPNAWEAMTRFD